MNKISLAKNALLLIVGVCFVSAMAQTSVTEDFSEIKILNTQVYGWVKNIVMLGGFIWLLIEAVTAWTQGRIAQAATWYKLLGIIAGILLVSSLATIWTAIFGSSALG